MSVVGESPSGSLPFGTRRRTVVIGVLGCGTVGGGVVARLLETKRAGSESAVLSRVLVRDLSKLREPAAVNAYLTTDPSDIVDDPRVDIVVETIGGIEIARELVERALRNGKHVITANKTLVATHGRALSRLARQYHVALRYEAAVGGAVPIVRAVTDALAAEEVLEIAGVMNGTSNFIVGEMAAGGSFEEVLKRAQDAGYAEPDPTNDVDGHDAAQKLCVLSALGFRGSVDVNQIWRGTLRSLRTSDFALAKSIGCTIVPLSLAQRDGETLRAMVAPSFVALDHDFARAAGPGNVFRVHGQDSGPLQFTGTGAGRVPTASAVFSDLAEIAHKMARWEYLGADPLPEEFIAVHGIRLPVVVRVEVGEVPELLGELTRLGIAATTVADNAVQTEACVIDELAAQLADESSPVKNATLFPCFEV
jgi:homoserine dehydrogenase